MCQEFCPQGGHVWHACPQAHIPPGTHTPRHTCLPGQTCPLGTHAPRDTHAPWAHTRACMSPWACTLLLRWILRDAVNEQAVRILLECILVKNELRNELEFIKKMNTCTELSSLARNREVKILGGTIRVKMCFQIRLCDYS